MPHILFCTNSLAKFNLSWKMRAEAVRDAGYEVHVAAPFDQKVSNQKNITLYPYQLDRKSLNPISQFKSLYSLFRVIKEIKPDLIHAITAKPNIFSGLLAHLSGRPPLVMSVTGLGFVFTAEGRRNFYLRKLILELYRLATCSNSVRIIFENFDDLNLFKQAGISKPHRLRRIPGGGIDLSRYRFIPEPDGIPLVVLASRMLWDKGIGEFIEAIQIIKESGLEARFVLVGDTDQGNPAAVPSSMIKEWQEGGLLEWWGYRENMYEVYSKSHIICLPSYREGMPRTLIEAAACGRPIVTTDVPGCREIVRDDENGYLVPARDSRSLAIALERLITNCALRRNMGRRGVSIAMAEFSFQKLTGKLLSIYQELLN